MKNKTSASTNTTSATSAGEGKPKFKIAPDSRGPLVNLSDIQRTKKVDSKLGPQGDSSSLFSKLGQLAATEKAALSAEDIDNWVNENIKQPGLSADAIKNWVGENVQQPVSDYANQADEDQRDFNRDLGSVGEYFRERTPLGSIPDAVENSISNRDIIPARPATPTVSNKQQPNAIRDALADSGLFNNNDTLPQAPNPKINQSLTDLQYGREARYPSGDTMSPNALDQFVNDKRLVSGNRPPVNPKNILQLRPNAMPVGGKNVLGIGLNTGKGQQYNNPVVNAKPTRSNFVSSGDALNDIARAYSGGDISLNGPKPADVVDKELAGKFPGIYVPQEERLGQGVRQVGGDVRNGRILGSDGREYSAREWARRQYPSQVSSAIPPEQVDKNINSWNKPQSKGVGATKPTTTPPVSTGNTAPTTPITSTPAPGRFAKQIARAQAGGNMREVKRLQRMESMTTDDYQTQGYSPAALAEHAARMDAFNSGSDPNAFNQDRRASTNRFAQRYRNQQLADNRNELLNDKYQLEANLPQMARGEAPTPQRPGQKLQGMTPMPEGVTNDPQMLAKQDWRGIANQYMPQKPQSQQIAAGPQQPVNYQANIPPEMPKQDAFATPLTPQNFDKQWAARKAQVAASLPPPKSQPTLPTSSVNSPLGTYANPNRGAYSFGGTPKVPTFGGNKPPSSNIKPSSGLFDKKSEVLEKVASLNPLARGFILRCVYEGYSPEQVSTIVKTASENFPEIKDDLAVLEKEALVPQMLGALRAAGPALLRHGRKIPAAISGLRASGAGNWLKGKIPSGIKTVWKHPAMRPVRGAATGSFLGSAGDWAAGQAGYDTGGMGAMAGAALGGGARIPGMSRLMSKVPGGATALRHIGRFAKMRPGSTGVGKLQNVAMFGPVVGDAVAGYGRAKGQQAAVDYLDQYAKGLGFENAESVLQSPYVQLYSSINQNGLAQGLKDFWANLPDEAKWRIGLGGAGLAAGLGTMAATDQDTLGLGLAGAGGLGLASGMGAFNKGTLPTTGITSRITQLSDLFKRPRVGGAANPNTYTSVGPDYSSVG